MGGCIENAALEGVVDGDGMGKGDGWRGREGFDGGGYERDEMRGERGRGEEGGGKRTGGRDREGKRDGEKKTISSIHSVPTLNLFPRCWSHMNITGIPCRDLMAELEVVS